MGGGLGQTMMTGMAFGAGSAVAHKAVDSMMGGGSHGGQQQQAPQQSEQQQQMSGPRVLYSPRPLHMFQQQQSAKNGSMSPNH